VIDKPQIVNKVVPGTQQVQISPAITMLMTIVTYIVTSHTDFNPPPEVWTAITGLLIYALQYWHGPRGGA
jgi:hypothetical protein